MPISIEGEVTIPASVEKLTYEAVNGCNKITALNVEKGNKNYMSVDGIIYSPDGKILKSKS